MVSHRRRRNRALAGILCVLMVLSFTFMANPVTAKGGGLSKLTGDIIVSTKRFPSRFKSDEDMYKHMRKVNTHELQANDSGEWEFEYMAFLGKPVATLQAQISYYDVTDGGQSLVDTRTFYPTNKADKIINGHSRLGTSKFRANRKYLMVFSRGYGQRAMAKTVLVLR